MSRPAGEPGTLAAGSRSLAAAAGALRDVRRRLQGATAFVVVAGAWRGPASEAFLVDGAGHQAGLDRAADALDQAAGALAELAARLEHAQVTWDRAQRLAATVGVDPAAGMVAAGQALGMAASAEQDAVAARRVAAARLDQAAATVGGGGRHGSDGHGDGGDGHGGPVRRLVGRCWRWGPRWRRRPITWPRAPRPGSGRRAGWPRPPTTRRCGRRPGGSPRRPGGR